MPSATGRGSKKENSDAYARRSIRGLSSLTFTPTGLPAGPCPRCLDEVLAAGIVAPTPVGRCPRCRGIWVSKPIRTAEERQAVSEVFQIVFTVIQFFGDIVS